MSLKCCVACLIRTPLSSKQVAACFKACAKTLSERKAKKMEAPGTKPQTSALSQGKTIQNFRDLGILHTNPRIYTETVQYRTAASELPKPSFQRHVPISGNRCSLVSQQQGPSALQGSLHIGSVPSAPNPMPNLTN